MNVKHPVIRWRNPAPPRQVPGAVAYSAPGRDTQAILIGKSATETTGDSIMLLTDDSHIELNSGELRLLQALALYRRPIPQTHRGMLEHQLSASGAWASLVSRDFLQTAARPWHLILPPHICNWLRLAVSAHDRQQVPVMHGVIASCWLEEFGGSNNATSKRRFIACEALYHLVNAGDEQRLRQIPPALLSTELPWALKLLKNFYNDLYRNNASVYRQRCLLQYRLHLEPENHVIHRFLGQCWQKEEGKGSRKAIACFETACRLKPDYPPYWADLGLALLATGKVGASDFLARIEDVAKEYPAVINDHVRSVRIACIKISEGSAGAVVGRRKEIGSGSRNPVFYADEAKELLKNGRPMLALDMITLAEQRGCGNDVITAIKCTVLEELGNKHEASILRLEKIALGSRNAAFYCDEAKARLAGCDPEGALAIVDLAMRNGLNNDHLTSVRATALQRAGKPDQATAVRMAKIAAGSLNSVFYNDEANARITAGDFKGAREMLELAVQYNCANQVTFVLWSKVAQLEQKDSGKAI